jgi:hypothetical protein
VVVCMRIAWCKIARSKQEWSLEAGAPARFSGRVGRLKKNKDSARSAEKIFCFAHPRSESAHPEIETQGGQS